MVVAYSNKLITFSRQRIKFDKTSNATSYLFYFNYTMFLSTVFKAVFSMLSCCDIPCELKKFFITINGHNGNVVKIKSRINQTGLTSKAISQSFARRSSCSMVLQATTKVATLYSMLYVIMLSMCQRGNTDEKTPTKIPTLT